VRIVRFLIARDLNYDVVYWLMLVYNIDFVDYVVGESRRHPLIF